MQTLVNTGKASSLKQQINSFKNNMLTIAGDNEVLSLNIKSALDTEDKNGKGGSAKSTMGKYNFLDMPSVGALTLLSKMQSDVRNTEADIIKLLRENIDADH